MKALIAALAVALVAAASGWTAYAVRPPVVHTRTVTVTRTAPPKVVTRWRTRIKHVNGQPYSTISLGNGVSIAGTPAAMAVCVEQLWSAYGALANGGIPSDQSLFATACPGLSQTGLVAP